MDGEAKLQSFLLLAKSARGHAVVDLLSKAEAEPGIFAYGELLDMPNVAEVRQPAAQPRGRG